jgi:hypothetical protein
MGVSFGNWKAAGTVMSAETAAWSAHCGSNGHLEAWSRVVSLCSAKQQPPEDENKLYITNYKYELRNKKSGGVSPNSSIPLL